MNNRYVIDYLVHGPGRSFDSRETGTFVFSNPIVSAGSNYLLLGDLEDGEGGKFVLGIDHMRHDLQEDRTVIYVREGVGSEDELKQKMADFDRLTAELMESRGVDKA